VGCFHGKRTFDVQKYSFAQKITIVFPLGTAAPPPCDKYSFLFNGLSFLSTGGKSGTILEKALKVQPVRPCNRKISK
jgi:hypothetical protein